MTYVDPYVKDTFRKNQPEGRKPYIRLDQNENQDGVPQWLFDEAMKDINPVALAMYPEEGPVVEKYAKLVGVKPENVTITDGSVVAMGYLIHVFGKPGKNLVVVNPTFNMYHAYAKLNGMNSVSIDYNEDLTLDVNKLIDAIDENTGIVVLVNPNMPVGNSYTQEQIKTIIQKAAKYDAFVIVDEAYYYFYEGSKTSVPLTQKYSNMAVLRTFSKMLAIPALRLGAVIGCEEVIHYVNNWRPHYTVNVVTLKFAEAIIDNHDRLISEMKATFDDGKNYVLSRLAERNYHVIPSNGCFLCIKLQHVHMDYAFEELKKRNILVFCGSGLLEDYVRLTVSSKKYMEKFVDALFEIDV